MSTGLLGRRPRSARKLHVQYRPNERRFHDGLWLAEKSAAVTAFVIRPHFYQTVWFGAICAGAVIAAVWLLWRWRLQQILEERTRLARELHDTAARGIVALVWQLEGVKSIAKRGNFDALAGNLDEASRLARESLRETRRAVRALRSEVFDSDCSLASALQKALQVAAKGTGLRTELKVSGTPYLTTRTEDVTKSKYSSLAQRTQRTQRETNWRSLYWHFLKTLMAGVSLRPRSRFFS